MPAKCIFFAILEEAAPTIERFNAQQVNAHLYTFEGGQIVITGMGVHPAQMYAALYGQHTEEIWNAGIAGALGDAPIGSLYTIASIGRNLDITKRTPPITLAKKGARLVTSDFGIHCETRRAALNPHWDLVDMEGYAIAYAAKHLGKKCRMWKIVSDFAAPGGKQLIKTHIDKLAHKLADHLYESSAHPSI